MSSVKRPYKKRDMHVILGALMTRATNSSGKVRTSSTTSPSPVGTHGYYYMLRDEVDRVLGESSVFSSAFNRNWADSNLDSFRRQ